MHLKENIQPISSSTDILSKISTFKYSLKKEKAIAPTKIGVSAQDVQTVLPELVHKQPGDTLGVNYIGLIPVLIDAIKELKSEIETLKSKVSA